MGNVVQNIKSKLDNEELTLPEKCKDLKEVNKAIRAWFKKAELKLAVRNLGLLKSNVLYVKQMDEKLDFLEQNKKAITFGTESFE